MQLSCSGQSWWNGQVVTETRSFSHYWCWTNQVYSFWQPWKKVQILWDTTREILNISPAVLISKWRMVLVNLGKRLLLSSSNRLVIQQQSKSSFQIGNAKGILHYFFISFPKNNNIDLKQPQSHSVSVDDLLLSNTLSLNIILAATKQQIKYQLHVNMTDL